MIDNVTRLYQTKVYEYHEPSRLRSWGVSGEGSQAYYKDALEGAKAASDYLSNEMPKFLDTLKDEFQKILGVENGQ